MQILHIQIQRNWNDSLVKQALSILWSDKKIYKMSISRGNDKGSYINFNINCSSGVTLWNRIGKKLNKLSKFKDHSIILTVVNDDWDNYKLIQSAFD